MSLVSPDHLPKFWDKKPKAATKAIPQEQPMNDYKYNEARIKTQEHHFCISVLLSKVFSSLMYLTHQRSIGFTKIRMESMNLQVTHTSIFHFTTDHSLPSFTGPCRASALKNLQYIYGKYTAYVCDARAAVTLR